LGIVTIIIMILGKVYCDPKYAAGYESVANLVNAGKTNKGMWRSGCQVKTRKPCTNLFVNGFLVIRIL